MIASARNATAFCAVLAMAACAQAPVKQSALRTDNEQAWADNPDCEAKPAIFVSPPVARQGETLQLVVQEPVGAYAPREILPELIAAWTASPAGLVTIAKNGGSLTVAGNATPGVDVTLSTRYCAHPISRTLRIVGKNEPVITGRWKQESISCTGETPTEPVRELIFKDTGDFSITYAPFESYTDFWGKADVNIAAGALAFNVEKGNRIPTGGKLFGKMSLTADGKLVLDDFFLSQPQNSAGACRYVFAK